MLTTGKITEALEDANKGLNIYVVIDGKRRTLYPQIVYTAPEGPGDNECICLFVEREK